MASSIRIPTNDAFITAGLDKMAEELPPYSVLQMIEAFENEVARVTGVPVDHPGNVDVLVGAGTIKWPHLLPRLREDAQTLGLPEVARAIKRLEDCDTDPVPLVRALHECVRLAMCLHRTKIVSRIVSECLLATDATSADPTPTLADATPMIESTHGQLGVLYRALRLTCPYSVVSSVS
eukprot:CAMPEP_0119409336 /NCGR_PEP_ID=MMETSP1335-20130426/2651_1 /TAXON_ID=259385 /ORGANISM="Chrysoculter rhomboideus, Strain RCC1486" /LENGTH=178 /DNA_ID=CAMNT_0007433701 /DNA_START=21 /DNA_END=557 /DNA_ORIENTATION=-